MMSNKKMIKPVPLKKGGLLCLVAPSGSFEEKRFFKGIDIIEACGYETCYDERIFEKKRYFAGSDKLRAEIVNNAFRDKEVKGIIAVRGGFGACRTLPFLDYEIIGKNPKVFCGSSDITLLNIALERKCRMVSFYGPMAAGNSAVKDYSQEFEFFFRLASQGESFRTTKNDGIKFLRKGKARGTLTGGCLSVINSVLGTEWEIDTAGKILFLEDIGEMPYKIERMLWQLKQTGKLSELQGLILCRMVDSRGNENDEWNTLIEEIASEIVADYNYPVACYFPSGHGRGSLALPVGGNAVIDSDGGFIEIEGESVIDKS